jgi:ABC-2 type transport system permease protein
MRSAIKMYFRLIATEIRAQLQYPASFLFEITSHGIVISMFFISLVLILERFEHIAGWTIGEVAFLYGMIEAAFGFTDMIFSGFDPRDFGENIRRGRFDLVLLRPLGLTLQVLGSAFVLRRLGRVLQGIVIFGIGVALSEIHWTIAKVIYLPIVFGSLIFFFGGLYMIGATITFWTVESIEVMNILTYGGSEMMDAAILHLYRPCDFP